MGKDIRYAIKSLPDLLSAENCGIAMAKNDRELKKEVDAALRKLRDSGEYDKIYAKWFGMKN